MFSFFSYFLATLHCVAECSCLPYPAAPETPQNFFNGISHLDYKKFLSDLAGDGVE